MLQAPAPERRKRSIAPSSHRGRIRRPGVAPELAEDERFRERFLRESRLAASLDHQNVIPIYEAGEAGGLLFIAMRYVEGSDLKELLREEGTPSLPGRCRCWRRSRARSTLPTTTDSSTAT